MKFKMKINLLFLTGTLLGLIAGGSAVSWYEIKDKIKWKELSDKHLDMFLLMNQWMKIKTEGKNLVLYLEKKGYKKIAIYGMSYVGKTLLDELKGNRIEIAYGIDKSVDEGDVGIKIANLKEPLSEVDAIIVTPIFFMDEIKEMLTEKVKCPIVSLEDILYEI